MTANDHQAARATESRRDIVEVRDIDGETALCPAEAVLCEVEGENQWLLYPAALLDEGRYVLHLQGENWPVLLRRAESKVPPAMEILGDFDPPGSSSTTTLQGTSSASAPSRCSSQREEVVETESHAWSDPDGQLTNSSP